MRLDDRRNSEKIINEIIRFHQKNDRVEEVIFSHAEYLMRNRLNPETYLERIIRQYPESPGAIKSLYLLGELNFNTGRHQKAAGYLEKYLAGGSVDKKNTAYLLFVISQKNLKNYSSIAEHRKNIELSSYEGDDKRLAISVFAETAYKLNDYAGTYELLKMEQLHLYEDQIRLYFIESAVRTGNITVAEAAAAETKGDPERYGDALFKLAEQCAIAGNTQCAEKGYSLFLAEIEKHPDRERAAIGLAGIHLYNGSYETAASYASMAVSQAMRPEAAAILILTDHYTGKEDAAAAASRKNIYLILKSSYAERVLYLNTERFRKSDDMSGFLFFAGHLKKFKGYDSYILFHTAEMNYTRGGFRTAFPSYVKLSSEEGPYKIISLLKSAGIFLFINKNYQAAEKAYLEIYSMPDIDIQYKNRSALELILIYRETGRHEDETRILNENRPEYTRDIFSVQISNLIDTTASNGDIIK
jgi:outer membrane protein assembly factor BamD (BamD/ComL family)